MYFDIKFGKFLPKIIVLWKLKSLTITLVAETLGFETLGVETLRAVHI